VGAEAENPPGRALSRDNHIKSEDLSLEAGREKHQVGVEEEAQVDGVAEGRVIEEGEDHHLASREALAF
jgi:hypothetical protein